MTTVQLQMKRQRSEDASCPCADMPDSKRKYRRPTASTIFRANMDLYKPPTGKYKLREMLMFDRWNAGALLIVQGRVREAHRFLDNEEKLSIDGPKYLIRILPAVLFRAIENMRNALLNRLEDPVLKASSRLRTRMQSVYACTGSSAGTSAVERTGEEWYECQMIELLHSHPCEIITLLCCGRKIPLASQVRTADDAIWECEGVFPPEDVVVTIFAVFAKLCPHLDIGVIYRVIDYVGSAPSSYDDCEELARVGRRLTRMYRNAQIQQFLQDDLASYT